MPAELTLTRLVFAPLAEPGMVVQAKASMTMTTRASTLVPRIRARAVVAVIRDASWVGGCALGLRRAHTRP